MIRIAEGVAEEVLVQKQMLAVFHLEMQAVVSLNTTETQWV